MIKALRTAFGLTESEAILLQILYEKTNFVSIDTIMSALYGARPDAPHHSIVKVFVCKIRKKINPMGIDVMAAYGMGYQMNDEDKAKLTNKIASFC
jgi:DNA-binding response OmpR family regulator